MNPASQAPKLSDLPAPPPEKTGWPWTEAAPALPATLPDGKMWPRISIVTPSYNQAQFIEQTLRSVLLQSYPDLEYLVIDGGSDDGSVEVIEKYAPWLSHWESEKDRGQSHAINKGFERASGEIIAWLNSDDFYTPGALALVAQQLAKGSGNYALAGHCTLVYPDGRAPVPFKGAYESHDRLLQFWRGYQMHQPSVFWRREVLDKVGLLDEDQHLIMDFDYWARIGKYFSFVDVEQTLSCATIHEDAKTSAGDGLEYLRELKKQAPRYWGSPIRLRYWRMRASMINHLLVRPPLSRIKRRLLRRDGS